MKKLLILLFLLTTSAFTNAQNAVTVNLKNGDKVGFYFSEKPIITYSGTKLILTTTKTKVVYKLNEIQELTFDNGEYTPVQSVSATSNDGIVRVYSIDGTLVMTAMPNDDGQTSFSLDTLPKGIYIVKSNERTYKISKK